MNQQNLQNQIYQPILDQQSAQNEQGIQPYQHYGQTQQDSGANVALLDHINYVRTTYVQYQYVKLKRIDPSAHPNHPQFYNFNVQENLPFRIDTIRIENLYDASKPDVYKQCFLEPISEDNQFQGWSESRLANHPFMNTIQELCENLQRDVKTKIAISLLILVLISAINITTLVKIVTSDGNEFVKVLGFLVSVSNFILSVMMGLQIARILRGFGCMKKLIIEFSISIGVLMIQIPIIFTTNPSFGYLPFMMGIMEIVGITVFSIMNKKQILTNSQLYMLINGHAKQLT